MRMDQALSSAAVALLLFLAPAYGTPIHSHCDTKPYSAPVAATNPPLPFIYNNVLAVLAITFNLPAPPNSPGCVYEISDVTALDLTFTNIGGVSWTTTQVGSQVTGARNFAGVTNAGGIGFFGVHEGIPPHQTAGALELTLPYANFPVFLSGIIPSGFTLTSVTGTVSGTHYYLPVPIITPEPATFLLVSVFAGVLLGRTALSRFGRAAVLRRGSRRA